MADAKLRQQRIDGAELYACPSTGRAQFGCADMVVLVGSEQWEGRETIDDVVARARSAESLKQLLQDDARDDDRFAAVQRLTELQDLGGLRLEITPEGQ